MEVDIRGVHDNQEISVTPSPYTSFSLPTATTSSSCASWLQTYIMHFIIHNKVLSKGTLALCFENCCIHFFRLFFSFNVDVKSVISLVLYFEMAMFRVSCLVGRHNVFPLTIESSPPCLFPFTFVVVNFLSSRSTFSKNIFYA